MATVQTESLREQIDEFKQQFHHLRANSKMDKEYLLLFKGLFMMIEIMLAVFMEKKTKKTSKNSGKPPSQTEKDDSALGKPGAKGKGKTEKNKTARNRHTHETVTVLTVDVCDVCGEDLSHVPTHECERRTLVDLIIEKKIEHTDGEVKACPTCSATVTAPFPDKLSGPLQYGNGIKAYIINLLCAQMVSLNRTQKLVNAMMGQIIAEATLLKFVWRLHEALEGWERKAKRQLLRAPALNMDETSMRVDKKNHWIHVYSAGDLTLKCLHRKRGTQAMNDIGILPKYGGAAIHDGLAAYFTYENCDHGLCGSHLLRELTFVIESNGYTWAVNMKPLLQQACRTVSKSKFKILTKKEYANLQKRYRYIVTHGEKEMPPVLSNPKGKRGKIAKSDAHNLLERFRKHERAILLFARDPNVSFTNNRAERDLRMAKVKQKVSGCFRTEKYANAYCRISSYLQTMANKGYNPLLAIQMAMEAKNKS